MASIDVPRSRGGVQKGLFTKYVCTASSRVHWDIRKSYLPQCKKKPRMRGEKTDGALATTEEPRIPVLTPQRSDVDSRKSKMPKFSCCSR